MSHFSLFSHLLYQYGGSEGNIWTFFSLPVPDWDSSQPPVVVQPLPGDAPPGPALYPGEEGTHSERCPPKLASRRAWETGVFPSPRSGAQGLRPRESFHHSLSAIHKQSPPHLLLILLLLLHPPPSHTPPLSVLPSPAHPYLHFYISHTIFYFIDISHFFFFTPRATRAAAAPSGRLQYVEVTACLACHCRRNKGVRYDTCPCYTPLCIFNVSANPAGQRSVSDKSHTMGNKFSTLSRSLLQYLCKSLKTSECQSKLYLY